MSIIFRPEGPFHRDFENIVFYCLTSGTSHKDLIAICLEITDSGHNLQILWRVGREIDKERERQKDRKTERLSDCLLAQERILPRTKTFVHAASSNYSLNSLQNSLSKFRQTTLLFSHHQICIRDPLFSRHYGR